MSSKDKDCCRARRLLDSNTNRTLVPQQWDSASQRPESPLVMTTFGGVSALPTSITRVGRDEITELGQKWPWPTRHSSIQLRMRSKHASESALLAIGRPVIKLRLARKDSGEWNQQRNSLDGAWFVLLTMWNEQTQRRSKTHLVSLVILTKQNLVLIRMLQLCCKIIMCPSIQVNSFCLGVWIW